MIREEIREIVTSLTAQAEEHANDIATKLVIDGTPVRATQETSDGHEIIMTFRISR